MNIEVSNGEILDKLSILSIKKSLIKDNDKIQNINKEYDYIKNISINLLKDESIVLLYNNLLNINRQLWNIEDAIRIKEKNKLFDNEFIELARNVYINNDKRAKLKKQINILTNSSFVEEKSYEKY